MSLDPFPLWGSQIRATYLSWNCKESGNLQVIAVELRRSLFVLSRANRGTEKNSEKKNRARTEVGGRKMSRGIVFGFQYFFLGRLNATSQEKIFGAALGL